MHQLTIKLALLFALTACGSFAAGFVIRDRMDVADCSTDTECYQKHGCVGDYADASECWTDNLDEDATEDEGK